jgi:ribosomal protein L11 methyltransferase
VPAERAEEARAAMLELFPDGFEEADRPGVLELAAYTDPAGAARLWRAFGEYSWSEVPEDWQHRWREFHRAVRVGSLWVGPPWLEAPADATAIVIDPGRAFGTGAHPTTQLCLQHVLDLAGDGGSLVDIGCGSGVLAIAACKVGFGPVVALDHDPVTLEAAAANARANGATIELKLAEALEDPLPEADVAVANISATAIEAVAGRVAAPRLITSGYLATERPRIEKFELVEHRELDGWAADRWTAPE